MNNSSLLHDPAFRILDLRSVHVRVPGPDYWRGFLKNDAAAAPAGRFQFSPPWRTVYAREVETALVRVQLADGTVGWGEATCPIAPEVICTLANGFVAELVRDRDFASPEAMVDMLYDAQRCRGYLAGHYQDAVAALDIALHDALARRAGCPVSGLFAAEVPAVLPCYLSGARAPTREERIALLHEWAGQATGAVKIFLRGDLDADLDEFAALRDAVPALTWWAADALWTFDTPALATRARRAFGDLSAQWLECPMLPEDLAGHVALRDAPGAPIALGEHFRTALQVEPWLEAGVVQVLQPDIGRTGFVMGRRMLHQARARGVAVTPHMGGALDVMQAATLHFAASAGFDLPCEFQAGLAGRIPAALRSEWKLVRGGFEVTGIPGLGVAVDEEKLEEFVVA
ncbi:enolase C-terminal domain-like protein [Ramlibacter sp. PS3R-8]|uniref:enolase C-terminal domain-like protein n=1 Tax=Ramlibacter sp. PS3R-8 TaxID=3133437 RepID=UPI0030A8207E